MDNILVSWLMPAYNAERTIHRALDSMLNQTYSNFEIIVINDASNDKTGQILEEYKKKDNRIKVYHNSHNLGVAKNLNYGLGLCSGKYIARMDADDFSYPERLEKQVNYMEMNPNIGVLGTAICKVMEQRKIRLITKFPTDSEDIRCRLLFNIQAVHPTIMFRKAIFDDLNLKYPECPAEDYALFASMITKVSMANLDEILLDYYVETDSQMTTVLKQRIRMDNAAISRKTVEDVLGVDTSPYPDSFFGARYNDIIPYDVGMFLERAEEFFIKLLKANEEKQCFDPIVFENLINSEWNSIKGMVHVGEFSDIRVRKFLKELRTYKGKCIESMHFPKGRVIIYGTGDYAKEYSPLLFQMPGIEVLAFCDSNPKKQGTEFYNKCVVAPECLEAMKYDYILIAAPAYNAEIRNNLIETYKVSNSRIVDFRRIVDVAFWKERCKWDKEYEHQEDESKIYLFCAPDYANLGDHAIAYAEKEFIENYIGCEIVEVPTRHFRDAADIARHHIRENDLILITGGGFLGSLWMNSENMTREIIRNYPNNRIIVMPQTLYWEDNKVFEKEAMYTREIYHLHKRLTLCARDSVSFDLMKKYYPDCHIILVPDMVLSCEWNKVVKTETYRGGVVLCLKDDKESVLTVEQKEKIVHISKELEGEVVSINNMYRYVMLDKEHREEALKEQLALFSGTRLCITDRLHGMLFAVITGTPCIVLNNCNHKLKASYQWVDNLPHICFVDDIDELQYVSANMIDVKTEKYDFSHYSLYYKELIELIKDSL